MTTQLTPRISHLHKSRVPHLRRGLIAAKVGIARKRDRFPFPIPKTRHPERSAAESKDPDALHITKIARTISGENALAFAFALASRYPKASALGLIGPTTKSGFSPGVCSPRARRRILSEANA